MELRKLLRRPCFRPDKLYLHTHIHEKQAAKLTVGQRPLRRRLALPVRPFRALRLLASLREISVPGTQRLRHIMTCIDHLHETLKHCVASRDHCSVSLKSSMAKPLRSSLCLTPCSCNHVVHCCRSSLLHDQPESKSTHAIPEGVIGIPASAMLTFSAAVRATARVSLKENTLLFVPDPLGPRPPFAT